MTVLRKLMLVAACLAVTSGSAYAQTALAGVVKDSSGAVLPGVTVEAASPVLLEKTRTAVTDGTGQYRIPDLTPGTYAMTFTLAGFSTVKREAVEVAGAGVISINADMKVGSVAETITVTGETPVVDIQTSTRKQVVLSSAVVETIPTSRGYGNVLATVPGIQATGLDVSSAVSTNFFTARGGRGNEGTVQIDGMNVGSAFNGGGVAGFGYPIGESSEIQVTIAGGLGETDRGGPAFNLVPKTGGNKFSGTGFLSTAGKWSQGDNLNDTLKGYGLNIPTLRKNWDTNFALGGPIVKDRLWFFNNVRSYGNHQDVPGLFGNKNAGDATKWNYQRDDTVQGRGAAAKMIEAIRLTGQASARNKVGFYLDYQQVCNGSAYTKGAEQCRDRGDDWIALGSVGAGFFGALSPESGNVWDNREKITQATWSSPFSNKLLLEAGFSQFASRFGGQIPGGALNLIPVQEQSSLACCGLPVGNFTYRGWASAGSNEQFHNVWRASGTYVTGAHSLKIGYQAAFQVQKNFQNELSPIRYVFNTNNPIQVEQRDAPFWQSNRTRFDAIYAQDQWTHNRLTLQGGIRYEHAWSWFPQGENGIVADNQFGSVFLFPETKGVTGYHDITPRVGAAYDVFGTGKTSLKVNVSKYLQAANNDAQYTIANPAVTFQQTTNRAWTDNNKDFVVDCNLKSSAAQSPATTGSINTCGVWLNSNFGNPFSTTTVNPAVLNGWGIRPYDWQFGVSVQQEIAPRVSVDVSYNRRWWGNFFFTDNRAVGPQDFDVATMTAPLNSNLPNGGGYPVSFYTRNARTSLGATDNYYTFASEYGDVSTYWHGFDVNVNARTNNGVTIQGGTSTGRGVRDYCAVMQKLPETYVTAGSVLANQQVAACAATEPWLTTVRGLVSYTVPKIDVLVSSSFRSTPNVQPSTVNTFVATNGLSTSANENVTTAVLTAQGSTLGRGLVAGLPFQAVDLTLPGQVYPDRVNSLDLRAAKVLRFGRTRTTVGFDFYNLFNSDRGTAFNQVFDPATATVPAGAAWLRPTTILAPRFARFNLTIDF